MMARKPGTRAPFGQRQQCGATGAVRISTACRSLIAAAASATCFAMTNWALAASANSCSFDADTVEALGVPRSSYVKVNNRKVLDGVPESIGLGGEANT